MNDAAVLSEAIRARGGRVTPQRLAILRVLRSRPRHVTAEELLAEVSETVPGVSLPTIYSTLELLEELGLVRRVAGATGGAAVYDSRVEEHQHAVCRRCGSVVDLDLPIDAGRLVQSRVADGFVTESVDVTLYGLCARCSRETSLA